ncbi:hypothetical protein JYU14_02485 [Simkania negevensis]|uniref:Uncharacterized protein n=1 Tax=Simkania negevensis TaxID=83561 RepID=A0ABS3ARF0_9BACT|nr:hypothetical protein [Simkania negevensis]
MATLSIFTPVISKENPWICYPALYLNPLGGEKIAIHQIEKGQIDGYQQVKEGLHKTSLLATALKITSYVLSCGILPLLAVVVTLVIRAIYKFSWIQEEASSPARETNKTDQEEETNLAIKGQLDDLGKSIETVRQGVADTGVEGREQPSQRSSDEESQALQKSLDDAKEREGSLKEDLDRANKANEALLKQQEFQTTTDGKLKEIFEGIQGFDLRVKQIMEEQKTSAQPALERMQELEKEIDQFDKQLSEIETQPNIQESNKVGILVVKAFVDRIRQALVVADEARRGAGGSGSVCVSSKPREESDVTAQVSNRGADFS